jgi:hypothetical protein
LLKKVTLLVCFFLVFQELVFLVTNIRIPGLIPGLPLSNLVDSSTFLKHLTESDRSSSIFAEPAHFAQYVSLGLIFFLFNPYSKISLKDMLSAYFITFSLILTRSGNAVIVILFIWGFWLLRKLFVNNNLLKKLLLTALIILIISLVYFFYQSNENFRSLLGRVSEINGNIEGQISGYIRIYRGYLLYNDFNLFEKIWGIGAENVKNYVELHPHTSYVAITHRLIGYLNGVQEIIVSGGIIGVLLFLRFLNRNFKANFLAGKVCIMMLLLFCFIASCYNTAIWVFYWIFALSLSQFSLKDNINRPFKI